MTPEAFFAWWDAHAPLIPFLALWGLSQAYLVWWAWISRQERREKA